MDKNPRDMTLAELAELLNTYHDAGETISELDRMAIEDALTGQAWLAARLLDNLKGIDPFKCKGERPRHGTPNHRSYSYKVRKALGYSYP